MVKFGIVGTNWITEKLIDAGTMCEDFQLNAVYSRTEEKAKEFADKYKVENIYTDLLEMAKSGTIDAVYIATPNSLHYEQSKLFLENKIAVLCEKPIVSNTFLSDRIVHKINLFPLATSFFNTGIAPISAPTLGKSCVTHVPSKSIAIIILSLIF